MDTSEQVIKPEINKKESSRIIIYLMVFIFTLHLTPAAYINSSFLEQFLDSSKVGYIFTASSILTLVAFITIRRLLNRIGNYKTFTLVILLEIISLLVLSSSLFINIKDWFWVLIFFYIIGSISRSIAYLNFDIFIEHITENKNTGGIRGAFLTFANTAYILGPIISGLIMTDIKDAGKIYILGAILLIPLLFMARKYISNFKDSVYKKSDLWKTLKYVLKNKDLKGVFVCDFILNMFYAWMVIYTPIFLHDVIGFNFTEIGIIIGVALIPFVMLEIPLGRIADNKMGETEIMTLGFVIMAIFTSLMSFVDYKSIILWTAILFVTRVGASMVEIMTESYLFKKINDDSVSVLSLYRSNRPVSYIVGPVLASIILIFTGIQSLFLILGIVVLYGVVYSTSIQDTL